MHAAAATGNEMDGRRRSVELTFTLLDQGLLTSVLADPTRIRREVEARGLRDTVVCIDEIQKCPALIDEVQLIIETRGIRFLLTGSSARALRRKGVNLLGGRGSDRVMHPFRGASYAREGDSRWTAPSTTACCRPTTCPTTRTRSWPPTWTAT